MGGGARGTAAPHGPGPTPRRAQRPTCLAPQASGFCHTFFFFFCKFWTMYLGDLLIWDYAWNSEKLTRSLSLQFLRTWCSWAFRDNLYFVVLCLPQTGRDSSLERLLSPQTLPAGWWQSEAPGTFSPHVGRGRGGAADTQRTRGRCPALASPPDPADPLTPAGHLVEIYILRRGKKKPSILLCFEQKTSFFLWYNET